MVGDKKIVKTILLVNTLFILFPQLSWTFDAYPLPTGPHLVHNQQLLNLPKSMAHINTAHQTQQGPTIIHISDLHCHYEVQNNIADIITWLHKNFDLNLITVEGSSQAINVNKLATFPDQTVKKIVGQYFMQQGKITGAEFSAALSKKTIQLEGMESAHEYEQSLSLIKNFFHFEAQGLIQDIKDSLFDLKPKLYSKALQNFDQFLVQYNLGKLSLNHYIHQLILAAHAQQLDIQSFTVIKKYTHNKNHQLESIEPDLLFQEINLLDQLIRQKLYSQPRAEQLDRLIDRIRILERLLNISITPDEWLVIQRNRNDFSLAAFEKFISTHQTTSPTWSIDRWQLNKAINQAFEFYQLADKRSQSFVTNTLNHMNKHQSQLTVMITGGFHTPQVLNNLKQAGVSYLSLTPKLTKYDQTNPYFNLLAEQPNTLEMMLAKSQINFALRSNFPTSPAKGNQPLSKSVRAAMRLMELSLKSIWSYQQLKTNDALDGLQEPYKNMVSNYISNGDMDLDISNARQDGNSQTIIFPVKQTGSPIDLYIVFRHQQFSPTENLGTIPLPGSYELVMCNEAQLKSNMLNSPKHDKINIFSYLKVVAFLLPLSSWSKLVVTIHNLKLKMQSNPPQQRPTTSRATAAKFTAQLSDRLLNLVTQSKIIKPLETFVVLVATSILHAIANGVTYYRVSLFPLLEQLLGLKYAHMTVFNTIIPSIMIISVMLDIPYMAITTVGAVITWHLLRKTISNFIIYMQQNSFPKMKTWVINNLTFLPNFILKRFQEKSKSPGYTDVEYKQMKKLMMALAKTIKQKTGYSITKIHQYTPEEQLACCKLIGPIQDNLLQYWIDEELLTDNLANQLTRFLAASNEPGNLIFDYNITSNDPLPVVFKWITKFLIAENPVHILTVIEPGVFYHATGMPSVRQVTLIPALFFFPATQGELDVFELPVKLTVAQRLKLLEFSSNHLNEKYKLTHVALGRIARYFDPGWYCSELVLAQLAHIGIKLKPARERFSIYTHIYPFILSAMIFLPALSIFGVCFELVIAFMIITALLVVNAYTNPSSYRIMHGDITDKGPSLFHHHDFNLKLAKQMLVGDQLLNRYFWSEIHKNYNLTIDQLDQLTLGQLQQGFNNLLLNYDLLSEVLPQDYQRYQLDKKLSTKLGKNALTEHRIIINRKLLELLYAPLINTKPTTGLKAVYKAFWPKHDNLTLLHRYLVATQSKISWASFWKLMHPRRDDNIFGKIYLSLITAIFALNAWGELSTASLQLYLQTLTTANNLVPIIGPLFVNAFCLLGSLWLLLQLIPAVDKLFTLLWKALVYSRKLIYQFGDYLLMRWAYGPNYKNVIIYHSTWIHSWIDEAEEFRQKQDLLMKNKLGQWPILKSFYKLWPNLLPTSFRPRYDDFIVNVIAPTITEGAVALILSAVIGLPYLWVIAIWYGLHLDFKHWQPSLLVKQISQLVTNRNLFIIGSGSAFLISSIALFFDPQSALYPWLATALFSMVHLLNNYFIHRSAYQKNQIQSKKVLIADRPNLLSNPLWPKWANTTWSSFISIIDRLRVVDANHATLYSFVIPAMLIIGLIINVPYMTIITIMMVLIWHLIRKSIPQLIINFQNSVMPKINSWLIKFNIIKSKSPSQNYSKVELTQMSQLTRALIKLIKSNEKQLKSKIRNLPPEQQMTFYIHFNKIQNELVSSWITASKLSDKLAKQIQSFMAASQQPGRLVFDYYVGGNNPLPYIFKWIYKFLPAENPPHLASIAAPGVIFHADGISQASQVALMPALFFFLKTQGELDIYELPIPLTTQQKEQFQQFSLDHLNNKYKPTHVFLGRLGQFFDPGWYCVNLILNQLDHIGINFKPAKERFSIYTHIYPFLLTLMIILPALPVFGATLELVVVSLIIGALLFVNFYYSPSTYRVLHGQVLKDTIQGSVRSNLQPVYKAYWPKYNNLTLLHRYLVASQSKISWMSLLNLIHPRHNDHILGKMYLSFITAIYALSSWGELSTQSLTLYHLTIQMANQVLPFFGPLLLNSFYLISTLWLFFKLIPLVDKFFTQGLIQMTSLTKSLKEKTDARSNNNRLGQWPVLKSFYKLWLNLLPTSFRPRYDDFIVNVIAPTITEGAIALILSAVIGLPYLWIIAIWYGLHLDFKHWQPSQLAKQISQLVTNKNLFIIGSGSALLISSIALFFDPQSTLYPWMASTLFSMVHLIVNFNADQKSRFHIKARANNHVSTTAGSSISFSLTQQIIRKLIRGLLFVNQSSDHQPNYWLPAFGKVGLLIGRLLFWLAIIMSNYQTNTHVKSYSKLELLRWQNNLNLIRFSKSGHQFTPTIKSLQQMPGSPTSRFWRFIQGKAWSMDTQKRAISFYLPSGLIKADPNSQSGLFMYELASLVMEQTFEQESQSNLNEPSLSPNYFSGTRHFINQLEHQLLSTAILAQYYQDNQAAYKRLSKLISYGAHVSPQLLTTNWIKMILKEIKLLRIQSPSSIALELALLDHLNSLRIEQVKVGFSQKGSPQHLPKQLFQKRKLLLLFKELYPKQDNIDPNRSPRIRSMLENSA